MLFFCEVCHNMGMCYVELSRLDAAEEAFSQSLAIATEIFPQGDDRISNSGETIEIIVKNNHHQACCFCS